MAFSGLPPSLRNSLALVVVCGLVASCQASPQPKQPLELRLPERQQANQTSQKESLKSGRVGTNATTRSNILGSRSETTSSEVTVLPDHQSIFAKNETIAAQDIEVGGEDPLASEEVVVEDEVPNVDPDEAILAEDSSRSPEELADLVTADRDNPTNFALCEGSIYMLEWQREFDQRWIAENGSNYRKKSQMDRALNEARSQAFLTLLFPTISSLDFDYPVVVNREVLKWIEYFQTRGRKAMVTWLKRAQDFVPMMKPILEEHGLPQDLVYLSMIESGFNVRALSPVSAMGPWQFMRSTGSDYGLKVDDFVDERRDPIKSTRAAARFLSDLYASLGDWHLSAASYNAGEGRIQKAIKRGEQKDFFSLSNAQLLPNETRNYVPKLIAAIIVSKNPEKFGFEVSQGSHALASSSVRVERSIALSDLAKALRVDQSVLENLNPELRQGLTPPPSASRPFYDIRVPDTHAAEAQQAIASLPSPSLYRYIAGRMTRKETAANIARRLGIPMADFLKANPRLKETSRLAKGQVITLPIRLGSGHYEKLTAHSTRKIQREHSHARTRVLAQASRSHKADSSYAKVMRKKDAKTAKLAKAKPTALRAKLSQNESTSLRKSSKPSRTRKSRG